MSGPRAAAFVQVPSTWEREPNRYEILSCSQCGSSDWLVQAEKSVLQCRSCEASLEIKEGIVNCLSRGDVPSRVVEGWAEQYNQLPGSYSPDDDWWRIACWRRYLFDPVRDTLGGRTLVDFGCGTSDRVASIAPSHTHRYRYIGVDSSMKALQRASENMPGGTFIRADLGSFSPRLATADIVLCLGVLMYFPNYVEVLDRFLTALKPGGILLLHELIRRKSWRAMAGPLYRDEKAFPEPHGLPWQELRSGLMSRGRILHAHLAASAFRRPLRLLPEAMHLKSLRPIAAGLDSLWCSTVGRMLPAVGGSEVQLVFQKG